MTLRGAVLAVLVATAAVLTGMWVPTPRANPPAHALPLAEKIAVIGVDGLDWTTVATLPDAALANVSVRPEKAAPANAIEGWLAIASGARWDAQMTADGSMIAGSGGAGIGPSALALHHGVPGTYTLGRLVDAAKAKGSCLQTQGVGGNARVTIAGLSARGIDESVINRAPAHVDSDGAQALGGDCAIAVVEVERGAVGKAVSYARAAGRAVILLSLGDQGRMGLHPAAVIAPGLDRQHLSSGSTRRAGYVQLVDVATTVATMLSTAVPDNTEGAAITLSARGPDVAELVELSSNARESHRTTPLVITALLVVGILGVALAGRRRYGALLFIGSMPAATFVAAAQPLRGYVQVPIILGIAAIIAWCARSPRGVGLASAYIIALDIVFGARWQLDSPLGYSPLVAGRFAGLGNLAFGVFAAGVIIAMHQRRRVIGVALLVSAVVVDGAPQWGSDVGGTLALVTAGLVMLGIRGRRLSVAGLAAAGAVVLFALIDLARPERNRTHLGRFAKRILDGDAWEVIHRKLVAAVELVGHSPLTMLALAVAVLALVVANLRAGDAPHAQAIRALSVAGVLGFFLNDSGLAAAITLVWVAVPLMSAATRPPSVSRVARRVLL